MGSSLQDMINFLIFLDKEEVDGVFSMPLFYANWLMMRQEIMFSAKDSCIKYERICRKSEFALNQMKNFFVQCKCKDYISTPSP